LAALSEATELALGLCSLVSFGACVLLCGPFVTEEVLEILEFSSILTNIDLPSDSSWISSEALADVLTSKTLNRLKRTVRVVLNDLEITLHTLIPSVNVLQARSTQFPTAEKLRRILIVSTMELCSQY